MRFPIKITANFLLEPILHTFGAKPEVCYVDLADGTLEVSMGRWFHERVALSEVADGKLSDWPWYGGLGVKLYSHGEIGVVGSTEGVVEVLFKRPQKMHALVVVECNGLRISLEDPDGFLRALHEALGGVRPGGG